MSDRSSSGPGGPLTMYPPAPRSTRGESAIHTEELIAARHMLRERFRDATEVYVGASMRIYYQESNPEAFFAPAVFVVRNLTKRRRRVFKVWIEARTPDFVLEIGGFAGDEEPLKEVCRGLDVEELMFFDPEGESIEPRIELYRLEEGEYALVAPEEDGSVVSRVTGVRFSVTGIELRCARTATGEAILRPDDLSRSLRQAEAARHQAERTLEATQRALGRAERRAEQAEAELVRLRRASAAPDGTDG